MEILKEYKRIINETDKIISYNSGAQYTLYNSIEFFIKDNILSFKPNLKMDILKKYHEVITETNNIIAENKAIQLDIKQKTITEINLFNEEVKKFFNKHHHRDNEYYSNNNFDEKFIIDKKVFIHEIYKYKSSLPPISFLKKICTIVNSPLDAEIVIYDYLADLKLNIQAHIEDETIKILNIYYKLLQNTNCKLIDSSCLVFSDNIINKFTEDKLPEDVKQSISMMLKSNDIETFNLGWKLLWKYNYVKNIKAFSYIIKNANKKSFYNRTKPNEIEYSFYRYKNLKSSIEDCLEDSFDDTSKSIIDKWINTEENLHETSSDLDIILEEL